MNNEINSEFILICGCPRSGTYLISQLLESSFDIAIPIETHFIPIFKPFLFLWGNLSKPKNMKKLLEAIQQFTRLWIHVGTRSQSPEEQENISIIDALRSELEPSKEYKQLIHEIYKKFAELNGLNSFADKSAPFEPENLKNYDDSVINMRVIHIIRDGRDVCLSWRKQWFGPNTIAEAAWLWQQHVKERKKWGEMYPERYLEVHYESLVSNPIQELGRIARFIGAKEPKVIPKLSGRLSSVLRNEVTHRKLGNALDSNNIEKWHQNMSNFDQQLFQYIAGRELNYYGYTSNKKFLNWKEQFLLKTYYSFGIILRYLSIKYYQRRLRNCLPIFIRITQFVQLDFANMIIAFKNK